MEIHDGGTEGGEAVTKPGYYSKVVEDLLNYREYKQRIIMIHEEQESKLASGMGIDYSKVFAQSSNLFDSTAQTALKRLDEDIIEEYHVKLQVVKRVEIAYEGLDPIEKFVIYQKYMRGFKEQDKNIYTHPKFKFGRSKYYEIKDEAVAKMTRIMGYI